MSFSWSLYTPFRTPSTPCTRVSPYTPYYPFSQAQRDYTARSVGDANAVVDAARLELATLHATENAAKEAARTAKANAKVNQVA